MATWIETRIAARTARALTPEMARAAEALGLGALRWSLVALLAAFGALKFTAHEAAAIRPLVENSPLVGWLYAFASERTASALVGAAELSTAILLALRRWSAVAGAAGGMLASCTFLVTLSFLATTPGALSPGSTVGAFLAKDLALLGGALALGAEALRAAVDDAWRRPA